MQVPACFCHNDKICYWIKQNKKLFDEMKSGAIIVIEIYCHKQMTGTDNYIIVAITSL